VIRDQSLEPLAVYWLPLRQIAVISASVTTSIAFLRMIKI
jgi:hypothetical protein